MCGRYDDPSTLTDETCDGWTRWEGIDARCGQVVGLIHWTDYLGVERAACHFHVADLKRKFPVSVDASDVEKVRMVVA